MLKLDTELEVNANQYKAMTENFKGLIAHRKKKDKYFIKPLSFMGYKSEMETLIWVNGEN